MRADSELYGLNVLLTDSGHCSRCCSSYGSAHRYCHFVHPLTVFQRHREMVALQLPHLKWDDALPPIASFYSYAAVMKE